MGKLQPLDGTECEVKRMDRSTEYSKEFAEIKSQSRISGSCQSCQSNMNRNDGFIHPWLHVIPKASATPTSGPLRPSYLVYSPIAQPGQPPVFSRFAAGNYLAAMRPNQRDSPHRPQRCPAHPRSLAMLSFAASKRVASKTFGFPTWPDQGESLQNALNFCAKKMGNRNICQLNIYNVICIYANLSNTWSLSMSPCLVQLVVANS